MENKPKLEPSEVEKKGRSKCPICKEDATLVCGGCHSVSYCSVDHQKKHWKFHQSSCVFFHIKSDLSEFTGAGKYCVASRDLKAGTIILEEVPVFQMPSNDLDRCITCGIDIPPKSGRNASHSCTKCNWPVCGTACAEFSLHAANECQVFVTNGIPYPKLIPGSPIPALALYSRSMRTIAVMIQDPQRWEMLMRMLEWEDIESEILDIMIGDNLDLDALKTASSRFLNITRKSKSPLVGVLHKLSRLMLTQGYYIKVREDLIMPGSTSLNIRHRAAEYLFKTARHFVHSCSPNCFWTVGTFPDFKMQIRTSVAVKKGEKLTVSRFSYNEDSAKGTLNRQKNFQSRFQLPCRCKLCLDPTEFGTNQSAVVCELCKTGAGANLGFLLPIDPLNIADDAPWKCSKCKKITTASKFCDKLEEIFLDLRMKYNSNVNMGMGEKVCEAFIEMYRNKLVHPNHWLIQMAGKLIQKCHNKMNVEELSGYEKRMHFLLDIMNKTLPGMLHERMVIVTCLSDAIWLRLFFPLKTRSAQEAFYKELHRMSMDDLLSILAKAEKCQHYQKEGLLYYKHSPIIGRGQTVDHNLSSLQREIKCLEDHKVVILSRITEIQMLRLRFGTN